jgi:hypothetical protein
LTYIDYPALLQQSNMTYAAMVNKAGNVVLPSYTTVQSAMDDFIQTVHDGVPTPSIPSVLSCSCCERTGPYLPSIT